MIKGMMFDETVSDALQYLEPFSSVQKNDRRLV